MVVTFVKVTRAMCNMTIVKDLRNIPAMAIIQILPLISHATLPGTKDRWQIEEILVAAAYYACYSSNNQIMSNETSLR